MVMCVKRETGWFQNRYISIHLGHLRPKYISHLHVMKDVDTAGHLGQVYSALPVWLSYSSPVEPAS